MYRSGLLCNLARLIRIARECDDGQIPTLEGIERFDARRQGEDTRLGRREWLVRVGRTAAATVVASAAAPVRHVAAWPGSSQMGNVGIVGAGLAGLACADELQSAGIRATLYDASVHTGGRCASLRGLFPGQVAERGGEFIDNLHKTMLGYARRFDLSVEDVSKEPGDLFYVFGGQRWPESVVVDQFREFAATMRVDFRRLSQEVTADRHTDTDEQLDRTSLLAYLEGQNGAGVAAGPVIKEAIVQAYTAEYGLAPEDQSCLNFLLFIRHADRRSKFTPFGVFSDERWHVVDGNDRITEGLTNGLASGVELGFTLVRVRRTPAGAIELTFTRGTQTLVRTHEAAVIAIPFSVLRSVELDPSLALTSRQRHAIAALGYGTNAKMMVGFSARPWAALGSNGGAYADLPNVQTTWETNPSQAHSRRAVITDYSGGARGAALDPLSPQIEAERFLHDLDNVYPGASAAATRIGGDLRVHLEHWPSNPLTRGSYTCYLPGQFTTIAGLEGQPAGNLYFAGEHANSFYDWQGFMEGAAISGIDTAKSIARAVKRGRIAAI